MPRWVVRAFGQLQFNSEATFQLVTRLVLIPWSGYAQALLLFPPVLTYLGATLQSIAYTCPATFAS